jgi:hypothetical protein
MNKLSINEIFQDALTDPDLAAAINIDDLVLAIQNDKNEHLDNKTLEHIAEDKYTQLTKLHLGKDRLKELFSKLSEYRYIDEIHQLHKGKHVRWIRTNIPINSGKGNKKDDSYNLTSGGIVVEIKFLDTGTHIMVLTKNPVKRCIQYKFDDCITFQKLSAEEQLILAAYEFIQET